MKKVLSFWFVILLAIGLCGCGNEKKDRQEQDFVTNMPVISIQTEKEGKDAMDFVTKPVAGFVSEQIASWTPDYVMPPDTYYEDCTITLTDADGNVTGQNLVAKVKVRGNWTTTYDKKPLRIKFDKKQAMFGLNDGAEMKNWVLLAEYKDASMLRNKVALTMASEILEKDGLYASDACLVEVKINGNYWGVYLLAEQQEVKKDRVHIAEAEEDYMGVDIGYFLEYDGYNYSNENELESFWVNYNEYAPLVPFNGQKDGEAATNLTFIDGFTIKSDIYSWEQHDFIAAYVNDVYRIMYAAAYEDKAYVFHDDYKGIYETDTISPKEAVERVVNLESLADMYIMSEVTCDADIYWSSFFMDVDFSEGGDKKLTFEAPWDFDSAFGNKDRLADGKGFYAANVVWDVNDSYESINPWLAVLMHEDWFTDLIREKWTAVYDDGVFERAYAMIDSDAETYEAAFERNYSTWNNINDRSAFGHELSAQAAACKTHKQAAGHLRKWLAIRVEFLNQYWHK